ncbi:UNKNOWN [Stylonychia lemnae]|uniref:Transmembrane protein n=1 Tax=Stylonychia lemnae TaxID=5949 RepID=A0A077ZUQ8_STYLE|nr:UNKNOWN [Stylonychia lemnae]|eukprot:CDW73632.1 UNKNOWN [Stylonychia lemnae]
MLILKFIIILHQILSISAICLRDERSDTNRCTGVACQETYQCEWFCSNGVCTNERPPVKVPDIVFILLGCFSFVIISLIIYFFCKRCKQNDEEIEEFQTYLETQRGQRDSIDMGGINNNSNIDFQANYSYERTLTTVQQNILEMQSNNKQRNKTQTSNLDHSGTLLENTQHSLNYVDDESDL